MKFMKKTQTKQGQRQWRNEFTGAVKGFPDAVVDELDNELDRSLETG